MDAVERSLSGRVSAPGEAPRCRRALHALLLPHLWRDSGYRANSQVANRAMSRTATVVRGSAANSFTKSKRPTCAGEPFAGVSYRLAAGKKGTLNSKAL